MVNKGFSQRTQKTQRANRKGRKPLRTPSLTITHPSSRRRHYRHGVGGGGLTCPRGVATLYPWLWDLQVVGREASLSPGFHPGLANFSLAGCGDWGADLSQGCRPDFIGVNLRFTPGYGIWDWQVEKMTPPGKAVGRRERELPCPQSSTLGWRMSAFRAAGIGGLTCPRGVATLYPWLWDLQVVGREASLSPGFHPGLANFSLAGCGDWGADLSQGCRYALPLAMGFGICRLKR